MRSQYAFCKGLFGRTDNFLDAKRFQLLSEDFTTDGITITMQKKAILRHLGEPRASAEPCIQQLDSE